MHACTHILVRERVSVLATLYEFVRAHACASVCACVVFIGCVYVRVCVRERDEGENDN